MQPMKKYSKGYEVFRQQVMELGGLEVPLAEVTFWDSRLKTEKRREILDSCGFDWVPESCPWIKLKHEQREIIKLKVRNLVRGYAPFAGLEVKSV